MKREFSQFISYNKIITIQYGIKGDRMAGNFYKTTFFFC